MPIVDFCCHATLYDDLNTGKFYARLGNFSRATTQYDTLDELKSALRSGKFEYDPKSRGVSLSQSRLRYTD
jgi:hypothetical protein